MLENVELENLELENSPLPHQRRRTSQWARQRCFYHNHWVLPERDFHPFSVLNWTLSEWRVLQFYKISIGASIEFPNIS